MPESEERHEAAIEAAAEDLCGGEHKRFGFRTPTERPCPGCLLSTREAIAAYEAVLGGEAEGPSGLEAAGERMAVVLRGRLSSADGEGVDADPELVNALAQWNAARNALYPALSEHPEPCPHRSRIGDKMGHWKCEHCGAEGWDDPAEHPEPGAREGEQAEGQDAAFCTHGPAEHHTPEAPTPAEHEARQALPAEASPPAPSEEGLRAALRTARRRVGQMHKAGSVLTRQALATDAICEIDDALATPNPPTERAEQDDAVWELWECLHTVKATLTPGASLDMAEAVDAKWRSLALDAVLPPQSEGAE